MNRIQIVNVKCGGLIPQTWQLSECDFAQIEYVHDDDLVFYIRVFEAEEGDGFEYIVVGDQHVWEHYEIDEFMDYDYWQDYYVGSASTLLDAWKLIYAELHICK